MTRTENSIRSRPARLARGVAPLAMSVALAAISLAGCAGEDVGTVSIVEATPDAGCLRPEEPATYEVFFVLDVSGSMEPFLTKLKDELVVLADGLPERDAEGRRVRVDYYLIAFVNDVKVFGGGRMTSIVALQAALDEAIAAGATGNNLTAVQFNAEPEENLLDALATIPTFNPDGDAKLVMIATDAPFVESPDILVNQIQVQTSYADALSMLEGLDARVHAFTAGAVDGLTRPFKRQPELTTLPGSTMHRLQDLTGANDAIRDTLTIIADSASCF